MKSSGGSGGARCADNLSGHEELVELYCRLVSWERKHEITNPVIWRRGFRKYWVIVGAAILATPGMLEEFLKMSREKCVTKRRRGNPFFGSQKQYYFTELLIGQMHRDSC
jgi:hypothetical protein